MLKNATDRWVGFWPVRKTGVESNATAVAQPAWKRRGIVIAVLVGFLALGIEAAPPLFAQVDTCPSLIANGGFENGSAGWEVETNGPYPIVVNKNVILVHSGNFAAYLGGVNDAADSLETTVALPADNSALLTYWWQIESEESGVGADSMQVIVASSIGAPLQTLTTHTDLEATTTGNYQQSTFNIGAFAGQTVRIQFVVETDANLETDFFLDDVAVATCNQFGDFPVFLPMTGS